MKKDELLDVMLVAERIEKYGIESFTDKDLLKMAIGDNSSLFSDTISQEVGMIFDSSTSFDEAFAKLKRVSNLTKDKAIALSAMIEYARRRIYKERKSLRNPKDVFDTICHYANDEQEVFVVVGVNGANEVMFSKVISMGIIDRTLIHPRETFADAIKTRCSAIFIAHNHPSGILSPSVADISSTSRLIKAGELLG